MEEGKTIETPAPGPLGNPEEIITGTPGHWQRFIPLDDQRFFFLEFKVGVSEAEADKFLLENGFRPLPPPAQEKDACHFEKESKSAKLAVKASSVPPQRWAVLEKGSITDLFRRGFPGVRVAPIYLPDQCDCDALIKGHPQNLREKMSRGVAPRPDVLVVSVKPGGREMALAILGREFEFNERVSKLLTPPASRTAFLYFKLKGEPDDKRNAYRLYAELTRGKPASVIPFTFSFEFQHFFPFCGQDSLWDSQYNLRRLGFDYVAGSNDFNLRWGGTDVLVAVVDSGCHLLHQDLCRAYTPPDTHFNYYEYILSVPPAVMDGNPNLLSGSSHGTRVAGLIGAVCRDVGVASIAGGYRRPYTGGPCDYDISAEGCRIIPCNYGSTSVGAPLAINWAVSKGAKVINVSLGLEATAELAAAVANAEAHGCLIVAAAGNDGSDGCRYPAAYDSVVAVGATGDAGPPSPSDRRLSMSNYGNAVDLMAPGVNCPTTDCDVLHLDVDNAYVTNFGKTSGATAQVSSVAALLFSKGYDRLTVRKLMEHTAEKVGPDGYFLDAAKPWRSTAYYYGCGMVRADLALEFPPGSLP